MMNRFRLALLATLAAAVAVASLAGTATAGVSAKAPVTAKTQAAGSLQVRFAVDQFVVRGNHLVAKGEVFASYASADGTHVTSTPFTTNVKSLKVRTNAARTVKSANRICDVLTLDLAPLHLELLGLIVDLDRVYLTLKGDSAGGLLGGLLCGLAGGGTSLQAAATQLTKAAQTSGLAAGTGFQVQLAPASASAPQTQALPPVPQGVCTVLDLPIGPIDLNLLGLLVHLDRTELRVTADPAGGILGSLLCGLTGGPAATTATAVAPAK
jgi:hypothetical protein